MTEALASPAEGASRGAVCLGDGTQVRKPALRAILGLCLAWVVLLGVGLAPASAQNSKEYALKAVFLFRLAQFTDWPSNAFETPQSPIVIGVLGSNPFGNGLEAAVNGETAHGRKIAVKYCRNLPEARGCHILFISESEARRVADITRALAGRSVLTVSDIEGFAVSAGGMVRFLTEQNKLKLRINIKAVNQSRLVLDARLLRAAQIVGQE